MAFSCLPYNILSRNECEAMKEIAKVAKKGSLFFFRCLYVILLSFCLLVIDCKPMDRLLTSGQEEAEMMLSCLV